MSHASWNVSLWINNDEGLYRLAKDCIRRASNREQAAQDMLDILHETDTTHTPDGVKYTKTAIREAMVGM
jgi:hypothetical protein